MDSGKGASDLERLKRAVALSHELSALGDQLLDHFIERARKGGCSWADIGKQLGVTKQAAQQRFRMPWWRRLAGRRGVESPFEPMTDRARHSVVLAQEEARRLNHNYLGTEHLLLGLIREKDGVASRALWDAGVSVKLVRQRVESIIGRGSSSVAGAVPLTPRVKKVLELAHKEAANLGHNYVGTEHILLALLTEGEGVAAEVLEQLGVEAARLRGTVLSLAA